METWKTNICLDGAYVEPTEGLSERESGWWPAGIAAALDIIDLCDSAESNFAPPYDNPEAQFLRVPANPEADRWEVLLGELCSPPNAKGQMSIRTQYKSFNAKKFRAMCGRDPVAFSFEAGEPDTGRLDG